MTLDQVKRASLKVTITFEGEEAQWLREYLQNFYGKPEDESAKDFDYRRTLFDYLTQALNQSR